MNSTALSFGTPDHLINLSSNQHQAVLTHWILKRYRKLMSNSLGRRPLPGSREEHLNLSQWAGVPVSGSAAKGSNGNIDCGANAFQNATFDAAIREESMKGELDIA